MCIGGKVGNTRPARIRQFSTCFMRSSEPRIPTEENAAFSSFHILLYPEYLRQQQHIYDDHWWTHGGWVRDEDNDLYSILKMTRCPTTMLNGYLTLVLPAASGLIFSTFEVSRESRQRTFLIGKGRRSICHHINFGRPNSRCIDHWCSNRCRGSNSWCRHSRWHDRNCRVCARRQRDVRRQNRRCSANRFRSRERTLCANTTYFPCECGGDEWRTAAACCMGCFIGTAAAVGGTMAAVWAGYWCCTLKTEIRAIVLYLYHLLCFITHLKFRLWRKPTNTVC